MKKISFLILAVFLCIFTTSCVMTSAKYDHVEDSAVSSTAPPLVGGGAPSQQYYEGSEAGSNPGGLGDGLDDIIITGSHHPTTKPSPLKQSAAKPSFFPIDDILSQLSQASFAYTVPQEANIDDEVEIEMVVNPSVSVENLKQQLPDGQKVGQTITISKVIEAKVTSNDFSVSAITPERQAVMGNENTTWKWTLTPKSVGPNKEVKITVSAIIIVDGEKTERYLETYTGKIKVKITPQQQIAKWFKDNWQWAWGSLLIPIGGFAWAHLTKKKKRKTKK